jgi:hypothetical protein
MQLSVAAYACAGMESLVNGGQPAAVAGEAMADCEGMDDEQLALCHAHCHGQSAAAHISVPPPLALPGIDLIGTVVFVASLRPVLASDPTAPDVLTRTNAPSIPVLNCCLRN